MTNKHKFHVAKIEFFLSLSTLKLAPLAINENIFFNYENIGAIILVNKTIVIVFYRLILIY